MDVRLHQLPTAIAAGVKRQERRAAGVAPVRSPKTIIDSTVTVAPVTLPPKPVGVPTRGVAPMFGASRLTNRSADSQQRDKGRARTIEAGPRPAAQQYKRDRRADRNEITASRQTLTRKNPAPPGTDYVTGQKRYQAAFSSTRFRQPFQKSYNMRRSFTG